MNGEKEWIDEETAKKTLPLIQYGKAGTISVSKNSYASKTITFPKAFGAVPTVLVGFNSGSVNGNFGECSVSASSVSATGFTVRVYDGNTSSGFSPAVDWVAIGVRS